MKRRRQPSLIRYPYPNSHRAMNLIKQMIEDRRTRLPERTNAYRISDGLTWPGITIDAMADRLLVSVRDTEVPRELRNQLAELRRPVYVKRLERDVKLPPQRLSGPLVKPRFIIEENGVRYLIDMEAGYSQGIFLDQRDNRAEVRRRCREGMSLLNTFAYTGAFSVCAALAGAQTTTLDLAQPCLNWCKENMVLNELDPDEHYFCKGDTMHWLDRFARQGRCFDAIVLDPPTFSRDEKGHVWRVEKDYGRLVESALKCLNPGGWLLCTTNCRKLCHRAFYAQVAEAARGCRLTEGVMPFDFDGEDYLKILWVDR